jgi:N-acetylglucosamine-6-phosphate deacetylase
VTTWYPTLVTNRLAAYAAPLARIGTALARDAPHDAHVRPTLAGVHLEGPFLGGAAGAHRRDLIVAADVEWIAALPHHVRLMTLGAEQVDAAAAIEMLRRDNRVVSIGHSAASEEQFDQAVSAGATLVTHLFNGMSGLHHRTPGVAAWAITDDRVSASLIADGVHVHPRMLRLAFRALGADRCILVTDSVAWKAGTVGAVGIEFRDGAPRLPDGTLAGSALTMDEAIRVCVAAGIDVIDAVRAASTNPARLMGLNDRGTIAVGQRADLVALDDGLMVEQVWVGGTPAR